MYCSVCGKWFPFEDILSSDPPMCDDCAEKEWNEIVRVDKMTEIEQKKLEVGNRLFELWLLLPETKKSYTHYYQGVDIALNNWHLSDREKRVVDKEKGDVRI